MKGILTTLAFGTQTGEGVPYKTGQGNSIDATGALIIGGELPDGERLKGYVTFAAEQPIRGDISSCVVLVGYYRAVCRANGVDAEKLPIWPYVEKLSTEIASDEDVEAVDEAALVVAAFIVAFANQGGKYVGTEVDFKVATKVDPKTGNSVKHLNGISFAGATAQETDDVLKLVPDTLEDVLKQSLAAK